MNPEPSKILHLSTSDAGGGAARAAYRLHQGLQRIGRDSRMLVHRRQTLDPAVQVFSTGWSGPQRVLGRIRAWRIQAAIKRYYSTRSAGAGPFTDDRSRFGSRLADVLPEPDVVNLHWLGYDFFDYGGFFKRYPAKAPVVWTLHDINVFTGGCHYDEGCPRWREGCGRCPQLGSSHATDLSHQIFRRKQRVFGELAADGRFQVVAASQWTGELARQSPLLGRFPVTVIPYGLDIEQFQPCDPAAVRHALGIGSNEKIVLFIAENLNSRRKGMNELLDALRVVRQKVEGVRLVCAGMMRSMPSSDLPMISLGTVQDDRLLALIYSAADVFVIPSLQEAFGLTALEAMACGTPVVGFDTGGIPDMVRPGKTGLLAPVGDSRGLADAIASLLTEDSLRSGMAAACREVVLSEYTLEHQAKAYQKLYG